MKRTLLTLGLLLLGGAGPALAQSELSLAGEWRFRLDRGDVGEREGWATQALPQRVKLPGGLTEQGIGDPPSIETKWVGGVGSTWYKDPELAPYATPGIFKFPYWLTPDLYYAGAAWFQRDIDVPADWAGRRVVLSLERAHWETRVWVDGKPFGSNNALGTPHEYGLGQLTPGRHVLAIRVDNRVIVDVGVNSHSISDHTQGNWNGIVGKIVLHTTPLVWIDDLQVFTDLATKTVRVKGRLGNATGQPVRRDVKLQLMPSTGTTGAAVGSGSVAVDVPAGGGAFEAQFACGGDITGWDEFAPQLYTLNAVVGSGAARDIREIGCGFRSIGTEGTQFVINGRKVFFRGTLECAIFPKTGHPPTDAASWDHVIRTAKAHGLNMLRFHSWCPPEAAFDVADRLGMYLQVECSSWANQSTTLGDGKPVDAWIYAEADRILRWNGNHPSFVLMLYGNEPGGKNFSAYLAKWVTHYREQDPRRLYSSGSGWPQLPENQFHVTPEPRVQLWGAGLRSRINALPPETTTDYHEYIAARQAPVISHEIGQWCVYPNFDEIPKYTGYLKAKNFEIFRDKLVARHMGDQAHDFLIASGKLQTLCYKEDIESALRTPGMGGFQLLDLHDFPGQGTALVGVLDPFWEPKGYVTAEEYRRFCNATVPLARLTKRVFTVDESLRVGLDVAHFGPKPLENAVTTWKLVNDRGETVTRGELPARSIPIGNGTHLGDVTVDLKSLAAPARYKLVVGIGAAGVENDWDVWVYPAKVETPAPAAVAVVNELTDAAVGELQRGGKVLWLLPPKRVAPDPKLGRIGLGFSSIFWNTAWTNRQPPHTLGILCDPHHPLFATFPTEFHSNWQWWYLISQAAAMRLDELPATLRPTVQVIDDWVTTRKLGLVFEAKVGAGKLIVCSIDLDGDLSADPVRRQFRSSLLRYVGGDQFNPTQEVSIAQVRSLVAPVPAWQKAGVTKIEADSEEGGNEAENAMDGDPTTIWHTAWRAGAAPLPHELRIEFRTPRTLRGLAITPRQDNRNGLIRDYDVFVSDDGKSWGEPIASGTFDDSKNVKTVTFSRPVRALWLKLVAKTSYTRYSSLAELVLLDASGQ